MTEQDLHTLWNARNGTTRKRPAHREDDLQKTCVQWFRFKYPHALIVHCPNGGYRNAREGARFKAMGVVAGFPDLAIYVRKGLYGALFIELKDGKNGRVSEHQTEVGEYLLMKGYQWRVVRSFDDFRQVVEEYMNMPN